MRLTKVWTFTDDLTCGLNLSLIFSVIVGCPFYLYGLLAYFISAFFCLHLVIVLIYSFFQDTGFGIPQLKNEAARCLHDQPGNQNIHEAKNHCGEKTENFKLFPSSSNLNISEEDNVAQV